VSHTSRSSPTFSEHSSDDDDDVLYRLAYSDSSQAESHDTFKSASDDVESDIDLDETSWTKGKFPSISVDFDAINVCPKQAFLPNDEPVDFFCKFFDEDVFSMLVQQTNLYAAQCKIRHWNDTSFDEMKAFIAALIGMGLHEVPNVNMYWSSDPLFRVHPIADIMPIKHFKKLLQALHVNDNTKAAKRGEQNFDKLHCISSSSQSIDEAMIIFKGRSTIKQYMSMKPVKRGFKVWVRTDSETGYVYESDQIQRKEDSDKIWHTCDF